jgi:murein DD-endopeptidase MepM/ murein hydrolase activator NlpD
MRGVLLSGIVLLIAIAVHSLQNHAHSAAASPPFEAAAPVAVPPPPESPPVVREGTLRRGDSLFSMLRRDDYPAGTLYEILDALKPLLDPRRLKPGDACRVTLRDGVIESLELVRDEGTYVVARDSTGFTARLDAYPVEVAVRKVSGTVKSSLYDAILECGGHPGLVVAVSDILQWDVDFFTDPRVGDTFSILVQEIRRGGEFVGYGEVLMAAYHGERASKDAYYYEDASGHGDHYDADGQSLRKAFLRSPLNYRRISSRFTTARFHPILKVWRPHLGVDYAAPSGTPVVALGSGTVIFAGWHNGTYTTMYAHLSRFGEGIHRGVHVAQGQVVGYVGQSGLATGPHLDFRVERNGAFIDPLGLKSPPAEPIPAAYAAAFHEYCKALMHADEELAAQAELPNEQFLARFFSESLTADASELVAR